MEESGIFKLTRQEKKVGERENHLDLSCLPALNTFMPPVPKCTNYAAISRDT